MNHNCNSFQALTAELMKNIGSHLQLCEMFGFVNIVMTVMYYIYCILMVVSYDPRAYIELPYL